ncbi:MAG: hypothetical protein M1818_000585 [Claussenomyces sp. TS43310]|nr:MAG: hypothetical protein M1818_000585 [Claussenomyces sp. TS43310]
MSAPIVTIAGFTGRMGRLITTSLLENHPEIKIHGIVRSPDKVDPAIRRSSNVTLFEAPAFDAGALRQALKGSSVCICCYFGDSELMSEGQKALIDACIDEKVARYIASDWCLDFRGLELGQIPAKDPMKHVQVYLEEKEKMDKIKAVHVLNGGFLDMVLAPSGELLNSETNTLKYWGSGDDKLDMITIVDAAAFTAEVAADPSAVGFLNAVGDRVSANQLVKAFRNIYGEELITERLGSLDELKTRMVAMRQQYPVDIYKWLGMVYWYYMLNGSTSVGPLDIARYPTVKPKSLDEFFRQYKTKKSLNEQGWVKFL